MVNRRAPPQTAQSKVRPIGDSHTAKLARNVMSTCCKEDITIARDTMYVEEARDNSRWAGKR
jgi:hypothetical protein